MRKFIKPLTALCCFTMLLASLCACSGETEKTVPESTPKHEYNEQRETSKNDTELSISFGTTNSDNSASVVSEDGITITGTPLSPNQLVDFSYSTDWAENVMTNGYAGGFLDTLNNAEFKDLYCRALSLIHLVSTDNIIPADVIAAQSYDERAKLTINGKYDCYMESGYTYDSFYAAYCSVFTQETADIVLSRYPIFYSYNGEMWFVKGSAGGNAGEVFQEYELINQTDTELEFKRISYSVAIGEPIEYDLAKKDEYEKSEVEFRFVKTADGWRAEKFLNVSEHDRDMLFA